jgi:hypothetical protein
MSCTIGRDLVLRRISFQNIEPKNVFRFSCASVARLPGIASINKEFLACQKWQGESGENLPAMPTAGKAAGRTEETAETIFAFSFCHFPFAGVYTEPFDCHSLPAGRQVNLVQNPISLRTGSVNVVQTISKIFLDKYMEVVNISCSLIGVRF